MYNFKSLTVKEAKMANLTLQTVKLITVSYLQQALINY